MVVRNPLRLAAAAGLLAASAAFADFNPLVSAPAATTVSSADQKLADSLAEKLGATPGLNGYQVSISCRAGEVTLNGQCQDVGQHKDIIEIVRRSTGVKLVRDRMTIGESVKQTQAEMPPMGQPPIGLPGGLAMPGGGAPVMGSPLPSGMAAPAMSGGVSGPSFDPMPINGQPSGGVYDLNPPRMPNYAWPTYAPYNNYSRVGYPTEYPHNAYPFIGPFYPFPKVPLGYRSIKLEWEDGHWWYGRFATKRDYWKIRYW